MRKIFWWALLLLLSINNQVLAAGFNLQSIGGVDTTGRQISQWWYTSSQPTLRGEATTDVVIEIDGVANQVSPNSDGNWFFTPINALSGGDHQVSLKSGGSEINFTLTIGADNVNWEAVGRGGGDTLPTVGFFMPTLLLMGAGTALGALGKRMLR